MEAHAVSRASSREVPEACRAPSWRCSHGSKKRMIRQSHKRVIILDQLHDGRRVVVRHLHPLCRAFRSCSPEHGGLEQPALSIKLEK